MTLTYKSHYTIVAISTCPLTFHFTAQTRVPVHWI